MDEFLGLLPEAQIAQFLDRIGPTLAERMAQEAAGQEKTDPAQAEKFYRQVAERKIPASDEVVTAARRGLALALVRQNQPQKSIEALKEALGDQVTLYPYGGHLGNLWYPENKEYALRYFKPRP